MASRRALPQTCTRRSYPLTCEWMMRFQSSPDQIQARGDKSVVCAATPDTDACAISAQCRLHHGLPGPQTTLHGGDLCGVDARCDVVSLLGVRVQIVHLHRASPEREVVLSRPLPHAKGYLREHALKEYRPIGIRLIEQRPAGQRGASDLVAEEGRHRRHDVDLLPCPADSSAIGEEGRRVDQRGDLDALLIERIPMQPLPMLAERLTMISENDDDR